MAGRCWVCEPGLVLCAGAMSSGLLTRVRLCVCAAAFHVGSAGQVEKSARGGLEENRLVRCRGAKTHFPLACLQDGNKDRAGFGYQKFPVSSSLRHMVGLEIRPSDPQKRSNVAKPTRPTEKKKNATQTRVFEKGLRLILPNAGICCNLALLLDQHRPIATELNRHQNQHPHAHFFGRAVLCRG